MSGCHRGFRCRLSGSRTRVAFLGEIERTIPRSRPASGRAPRAGLVQDAACGTGAQRRLVLDKTEHGAMLVQVGPASSSTATPSRVLPVMPGDRNELVEYHSEAMWCRSAGSADSQQRSCCDDQLNPPSSLRSYCAVTEDGVEHGDRSLVVHRTSEFARRRHRRAKISGVLYSWRTDPGEEP